MPQVAEAWGTGVATFVGGVGVIVLTVIVVAIFPVFWRYRAPLAGDEPSTDPTGEAASADPPERPGKVSED